MAEYITIYELAFLYLLLIFKYFELQSLIVWLYVYLRKCISDQFRHCQRVLLKCYLKYDCLV